MAVQMICQTTRPGALQVLLEEPLLLEVGIVGAGLVLLILVTIWVRRVARDADRRREVGGFVQGIDRFVRREWEGALPGLERVLAADPANLEARVALGDCYRELGRAAEAERLHTEAIQVFRDQRLGTRLALARDLLALDRADRALPWLEEILAAQPRDPDALETMAAAQESLCRYRRAADCLRDLLLTIQGPDQEERRRTLRRRIGTLLAREGGQLEQLGRLEDALAAFREGVSWNPSLTGARAGVVRTLATLGHGTDARQALEGSLDDLERLAGDPDFLMLPVDAAGPVAGRGTPARPALPGPAAGPNTDLPLPAEERTRLVLGLMEKEALFACRSCEAPLAACPEECPSCGALGAVGPLRDSYTRELTGIEEVLDEVEENPSFIRRLVEALYRGESGAARRIHQVGLGALPTLYEELQGQGDRGPLLEVIKDFGVAVLEPFLSLDRETRRDRSSLLGGLLHAFGERSRLLGELAATFGSDPAAEAFFLALAESDQVEERRAVLDYFVAAGRPAAFEQLQGFARVEVINHLSRLPAAILAPLLVAVREEDFLVDWVLVDPTLQIEEPLMEAFAEAGERQTLAVILRRRGFHPSVEKALHRFLCQEQARDTVLGVLASYGEEALPHRIPVLLDPDTPEEARHALADLVAAEGGKAVRETLLRCLGNNPSPLDEPALELVARIGSRAMPELRSIYEEERGLLAKFPLVRKRSLRRRELVLRAAGRIDGGLDLLAELIGREQDPGLQRLGKKLLADREAGS